MGVGAGALVAGAAGETGFATGDPAAGAPAGAETGGFGTETVGAADGVADAGVGVGAGATGIVTGATGGATCVALGAAGLAALGVATGAGAATGRIRAALAAASFASFSVLAAASAAASTSACPKMFLRTFSATSTGIELECVFFSVTPYPGNRSMIALALTSSSRANSLIRTWFASLMRPIDRSSVKISICPSFAEANC
ncbi:MAG TPA: hypothetical protein VNH65_12095 [Candidatus Acidoferrum sp.]|nr:hypothetical protein [Candidatus Acidoferrum sp.]